MKRGRRPSWGVRVDVPEDLHVLLFVRDALRLPTTTGTLGALDPTPPDLSARLDESTRKTAATDWPAWWQAALAYHAEDRPPPVDASGLPNEYTLAAMREKLRRHSAWFAPPFAALAAQPELQQAARLVFDDFLRWWSPPSGPPPESRSLDPAAGFGLPDPRGRAIGLVHRDDKLFSQIVRGLRRELHRRVRQFNFAIDVVATTGTAPVVHRADYAILPAAMLENHEAYRAWLHDALLAVA